MAKSKPLNLKVTFSFDGDYGIDEVLDSLVKKLSKISPKDFPSLFKQVPKSKAV